MVSAKISFGERRGSDDGSREAEEIESWGFFLEKTQEAKEHGIVPTEIVEV